MFNPYKHIRNAGCLSLFLASLLANQRLMIIGFVLVLSGIYGGVDLTERRVEKLEKETSNEKAETKEDC